MDFKRTDRLSGLVQEEIARLLLKGIKDPRVRDVVITGVRVSPDLRHARVFFTLLGERNNREVVEKGLTRASGFIRRELGKQLDLKYVPELIFNFDRSIEYGRRIEEVLQELKNEPLVFDDGDTEARDGAPVASTDQEVLSDGDTE